MNKDTLERLHGIIDRLNDSWTLRPENSRLPDDHRMFERAKNGHPQSADRAVGELIRQLQADGTDLAGEERLGLLKAAHDYVEKGDKPDRPRPAPLKR